MLNMLGCALLLHLLASEQQFDGHTRKAQKNNRHDHCSALTRIALLSVWLLHPPDTTLGSESNC